jgi:hypothetical protein
MRGPSVLLSFEPECSLNILSYNPSLQATFRRVVRRLPAFVRTAISFNTPLTR